MSRSEASAEIDARLAALPPDQRAALQTLRDTIAAVAPEAVEGIGYGIPSFIYKGKALLWYKAAKSHLSFFPTSEPVEVHKAELAGFKLSKGTIQFTPEHTIPKALVEQIVRERLAAIDAQVGKKK